MGFFSIFAVDIMQKFNNSEVVTCYDGQTTGPIKSPSLICLHLCYMSTLFPCDLIYNPVVFPLSEFST